MLMLNASDAIKCKAFLVSLKGVVRSWLTKQPHGLIISFTQLAELFLKHCDINKLPPVISTDLMAIKQDQGESLKSFLTRHKKCATKI